MPTQSSNSSVLAELYKYSPSAVVELFEIDLSPLSEYYLSKGVTISPLKYYFHNGVSKKAQGTLPLSDIDVKWGNPEKTYTARSITMEGVQVSSAGEIPRPTLTINNYGSTFDNLFTGLNKSYANLVGAKVTRTRTLVKFLNQDNFKVTNLVTNSEYNATYWTLPLGNGTLTAGQSDPLGGTAAVRLTCGGVANTLLRVSLPYGIVTNGTDTYTFSFYVKKVSGSTGAASADLNDATGYTYTANLVTGSWVRVSWTGVPTAGTKTFFDLFNDSTSNLVLDFFGLQVQKNATLTTYEKIGTSWNPTADTNAKFPDDVFNIDRMSEEVPGQITYELAPAWDVEGVALPRRQILANICPWTYKEDPCNWSVSGVATVSSAGTAVAGTASYTGITPTTLTGSGSGLVVAVSRAGGSYTTTVTRMGSGYAATNTVKVLGSLLGGVDVTNDLTITVSTITGANYYDENDIIATTAANDKCGKRYTSCKIRFGTRVMPFGGFPSAGLYGKPI